MTSSGQNRRSLEPAPSAPVGASSPPGGAVTTEVASVTSDPAVLERLGDPRDDLVEHVVERGGRLETQHPLGLLDCRDPLLDVVLERVVVLEPQRLVRT